MAATTRRAASSPVRMPVVEHDSPGRRSNWRALPFQLQARLSHGLRGSSDARLVEPTVSRNRAARSCWIGAAWAKRPSWRSSSVRSAAGRSARSSRSPRTPASSPAHSRCRPTIHEAVSLSAGSVEARSPATNFGSSPPLVHLVERDHRRADRPRRLALQPGRRRFGIGDLDQGISDRVLQ